MNKYRRFEEHEFDVYMPDDLQEFVLHIASPDTAQLIVETWEMDKPVSCLHIPTDISKEARDMYIEPYFNTYIEYPNLDDVAQFTYFSRFPEICAFVATCTTPVDGLLFGFDTRDVASYVELMSGEMSTADRND